MGLPFGPAFCERDDSEIPLRHHEQLGETGRAPSRRGRPFETPSMSRRNQQTPEASPSSAAAQLDPVGSFICCSIFTGRNLLTAFARAVPEVEPGPPQLIASPKKRGRRRGCCCGQRFQSRATASLPFASGLCPTAKRRVHDRTIQEKAMCQPERLEQQTTRPAFS
jgi:hypothetical protein